jgi:hypothetical protein
MFRLVPFDDDIVVIVALLELIVRPGMFRLVPFDDDIVVIAALLELVIGLERLSPSTRLELVLSLAILEIIRLELLRIAIGDALALILALTLTLPLIVLRSWACAAAASRDAVNAKVLIGGDREIRRSEACQGERRGKSGHCDHTIHHLLLIERH